MTPYSRENDKTQLLMQGFQAYFNKPITAQKLLQTLKQATSQSNPNGTRKILRREQAESPKLGLHVLVVETIAANQILTETLLAELGCSCDIADDGVQAIEFLQTLSSYDLVLMANDMPEMDGYTTSKQIRDGVAGSAYQSIPIIGLTLDMKSSNHERELNAGISDLLALPIDKKQLEKVLKRFATMRVTPEHRLNKQPPISVN